MWVFLHMIVWVRVFSIENSEFRAIFEKKSLILQIKDLKLEHFFCRFRFSCFSKILLTKCLAMQSTSIQYGCNQPTAEHLKYTFNGKIIWAPRFFWWGLKSLFETMSCISLLNYRQRKILMLVSIPSRLFWKIVTSASLNVFCTLSNTFVNFYPPSPNLNKYLLMLGVKMERTFLMPMRGVHLKYFWGEAETDLKIWKPYPSQVFLFGYLEGAQAKALENKL